MMNEATWDRVARVALGIALLVVGFGVVRGGAGTVIGLAALIPLLTGAIGWCPIYAMLNFRTNRTKASTEIAG